MAHTRCTLCCFTRVFALKARGESDTVSVGFRVSARYVRSSMFFLIYGLWRVISYAAIQFPPLTLNNHSLLLPRSKLHWWQIGCIEPPYIFPIGCTVLSTCLTSNISVALTLSTHLGFIAQLQTVFTFDNYCVKLVVEVKNQLFEGTSKWPMAADSWGLADPHYVL